MAGGQWTARITQEVTGVGLHHACVDDHTWNLGSCRTAGAQAGLQCWAGSIQQQIVLGKAIEVAAETLCETPVSHRQRHTQLTIMAEQQPWASPHHEHH